METQEPSMQQPGMTASSPRFDTAYIDQVSQGRRSLSTPLIEPLITGTGASIYRSKIIPAIRAAQFEIVLVTCFWASSVTRMQLCEALKDLSRRVLASSSSSSSSPRKVSVQICFSSSSLARNMLLPTPSEGQVYGPESWGRLGLPGPDEIRGLNLRVVRKFFWPWGIVHSKYVIVDRKLAIFPSCNVSWERWFEVAISFTGPVVDHLLHFHTDFWDKGRLPVPPSPPPPDIRATTSVTDEATSTMVPVTLLPSPHTPAKLPNHLHPRVLLGQVIPCIPTAGPLPFPPTPLLQTTHHLLSTAQSRIVLLTPNLTEPTVVESLVDALGRGVQVCIWTNRTLMTVEQMVTAGTTTPSCVQRLVDRALQLGRSALLETFFFDADDGPGVSPQGRGRGLEGDDEEQDQESIPVKLHAKVTIVDDERILLGSGNMDAASWRTSQELGVLVESREVVDEFKRLWRYSKL
ncbi:Phospholipase D/Transphosphatidylase [Fonsecaea pedrosoi]|nr:Phospholipase D/Transphosphatidylase [Fonsecaea pedrosoi]